MNKMRICKIDKFMSFTLSLLLLSPLFSVIVKSDQNWSLSINVDKNSVFPEDTITITGKLTGTQGGLKDVLYIAVTMPDGNDYPGADM